jgi:xanthine/CO dehydrogenase XdhC/CoxF family maturation factor
VIATVAQMQTSRQFARHFACGDIGAENPQSIALAIVAEIQAVLAGRPAGFLRDRPGPI